MKAHRAIRKSEWKLVSKRNSAWELYNMDADRSELNDLAHENAGRVAEMAAAWNNWASRCQVLPQPKADNWWRYSTSLQSSSLPRQTFPPNQPSR